MAPALGHRLVVGHDLRDPALELGLLVPHGRGAVLGRVAHLDAGLPEEVLQPVLHLLPLLVRQPLLPVVLRALGGAAGVAGVRGGRKQNDARGSLGGVLLLPQFCQQALLRARKLLPALLQLLGSILAGVGLFARCLLAQLSELMIRPADMTLLAPLPSALGDHALKIPEEMGPLPRILLARLVQLTIPILACQGLLLGGLFSQLGQAVVQLLTLLSRQPPAPPLAGTGVAGSACLGVGSGRLALRKHGQRSAVACTHMTMLIRLSRSVLRRGLVGGLGGCARGVLLLRNLGQEALLLPRVLLPSLLQLLGAVPASEGLLPRRLFAQLGELVPQSMVLMVLLLLHLAARVGHALEVLEEVGLLPHVLLVHLPELPLAVPARERLLAGGLLVELGEPVVQLLALLGRQPLAPRLIRTGMCVLASGIVGLGVCE
mmetsp:Transcript_22967/g.68806  ORF Transcript_22967/g.68806 Transcript_22967/m.68806 type:complete len:432 (+) Transcript_22967:334-1629(+)